MKTLGYVFAASALCAAPMFGGGSSWNYNGSGFNPQILTSVKLAEVGQPWMVQLDCTGARIDGMAFLRLADPAATPVPYMTRFGEVFVGLQAGRGTFLMAHHFSGPTKFGVTIPDDASLGGMSFTVQGFCGDKPNSYLSNGLLETIGFGAPRETLGQPFEAAGTVSVN